MNGDGRDPGMLAAEYALGVLEGRDLAEARRRMASSAEFRAEVGDWAARLAPLFDEIEAVAAPAGLWARIKQAVSGGGRDAVNHNPIALRRSLGRWRAATAGAMALAASLAILLVLDPRQVAPPPTAPAAPAGTVAGPPMVAMLGDDSGTKIVANWDPGDRQLVLALAGSMPEDPGRAHELWVIPADGTPSSLGTMPEGRMMHMELAAGLAELLRHGATIAISVEPPGGSPTGAPTGPMIVSGTLESS